jgi:hypothetical protein
MPVGRRTSDRSGFSSANVNTSSRKFWTSGYGPDETFYKVCADDGNLYILRHHAAADEWRLESFRRLR